ncbi:TOPRIM nucleotidyl transferase/hydrolase domain-containing protein [Streptomyces davaonensis]|nr:TOPRIM nucleotidyl transferase/hydrolase domain-containing protein [Streptomyces davaonensis]
MGNPRTFQDEITRWAAGGSSGPLRELAVGLEVRTVVLLEGLSDVAALQALTARQGRDLAAEGVYVVSMGGAMNVGRYAGVLGRTGLGLELAGLCDERERPYFDRAFDRASAPLRNVFVCVADLEDEFIRALGEARVEEIIQAEGEARAWQTFARQPAQHGRSRQQQLRRFLGTKKGRKIRYGTLLVEAVDLDEVPAPLDDLLRSL